MKLIRSVMALGLVLGATAFVPADAEAALMLRLTQDATVITITDNGAGDTSPAVGVVTFNGTIGTFDLVNVSTGVGYPVLGSETDPWMDLNSINISSSTGGTLLIENIQDGYTALPGSFVMSIGGTTGGTVTYDAFANATLIDSLGPFSGGAFSDTGGGSVAVGTPYTLTQAVTITHGTGLFTTSFDAELVAPEPASLALFALGLFGVGATARRRRNG